MNRWHADTCVSPNVVLDRDLPICNTCGKVPDLDIIRLKQQQTSPFPQIPPNEPPGQFNLHWPLSSLYSRAKNCRGSDVLDVNPNEKLRSADDFEPSPIYQSRLEAHEFRLVRLEAAVSGTNLLHIHLETHDQHRFPVYETVSYTWGGENNDNSRCRPVFIGTYWDILFQTQNCWDMLKFLQPADGLRRLWVDAICINQKDDEERGAQVSKMADIYQEAQRVLVYLGSSLIDPASHQKYPLRRRFEQSIMQSNDSDQLVRDGKVDVDKLLIRRYFSRLWVIQELFVSRQVVFQVGDTEFWVDGTTIPQLKGYNWENTPAPWLVHMAQGTLQGGDIYEAMRETWSSEASDPRDKVFGILALLNDRRERELFRPDYSLSFSHVFLGALAYSLLSLKHVEILGHAAGAAAPDGQPSWMISWDIPAWPKHCDFQGQAELAFKAWKRVWPDEWVWPLKHDLDTAAVAQRNPFGLIGSDPDVSWKRQRDGIFIFSQFSTRYKRRKGLDVDPGSYTMEQYLNPGPVSIYFEDLDVEELERLKEETWDNSAAVNASTGSLEINLTRICGFTTIPLKVHTHGSMMIFEVQGAAPSETWMYLVTDKPLDHLVIPTRDHLFILDQGEEKSFVILVLRRLDDSPVFRLIAYCYGLYFRFAPGRWKSSEMLSAPPEDDMALLPDLRTRLCLDNLAELTAELIANKTFARLLRLSNNGLEAPQSDAFVHDFLYSSGSKLLQVLCECINPRFRPLVNGQYLEISVDPIAWECILDSANMSRFIRLYKEMKYEEEEDWRSSRPIWIHTYETDRSRTTVQYGVLDYSAIKEDKPLHFRASLDSLHASMENFMFSKPLAGYQARLRSDALFCMPSERIVGEEAGIVTCPGWPRPVLKGFPIDGRMYRVCIT